MEEITVDKKGHFGLWTLDLSFYLSSVGFQVYDCVLPPLVEAET